ncbi:hypothetical protein BGX21_003350 [Mortierella sp. AD011]|nr:hypothetical protein BGX20_009406 [Mortierella sp. AD010]KAF9376936.1 hypothetical protein BGX21_003350 [Mortierella sp. AD011]
MRLSLFSRSSSDLRPSSSSTLFANKRMSLPVTILVTLLSLSLSPSITEVSANPATPGFCGDCQTFANAIAPCGVTFGPTDIQINGTYTPPQSAANCICSSIMQSVLWTCARCELLAGYNSHSDPPTKYHTTCISWGATITQWNAPYTGVVADGTTTPMTTSNSTTTGGTSTTGAATTGAATSGTSGSIGTTTGATGTSGTSGGTSSGSSVLPGTTDVSTGNSTTTDSSESSGPNGTAIGISLGIIGFACAGGAFAMFMMKRSRRRHEPLELDGAYVGLDDSWEREKPARVQSPPMIPAPAPITARGPARGSPFENRPGGGGSVVGGYDGQYDQYDHNYSSQQYQGGNGGYGYQGYGDQGYADQGYGDQGYGGHDYGYEHTVPTGVYHGKAGSEVGGQYL